MSAENLPSAEPQAHDEATPKADFEHDVFISYSHHDRAWVLRWLVPRLLKAGLKVYLDRKFPLGFSAVKNMWEAVKNSRHTLLVITPAWVSSEWSGFETIITQGRDPAGHRGRLVPLLLEGGPPERLSHLTWADFTSPETRGEELTRVIDALRRDIEEPAVRDLAIATAETRREESLVQRLLRWVLDRCELNPWFALILVGTLLALVAAGLCGLGLLAHRERESYLPWSQALSYPPLELLLTGGSALWHLPWRALGALFAPHQVLVVSAWGLMACLALLLATRRLQRLGSFVPWIVLPAVALLLAYGGSFYSVALHAKSLETPELQSAERCGGALSRNRMVQAAYETCTWLEHGPRGDRRRRALSGLLVWFLASCVAGAWIGARRSGASPRARWVLAAPYLALGVYFLALVPRAEAYARWGLAYPGVKLLAVCQPELASAVDANACCAFDATEGATTRWVVWLGARCPGGQGGRSFPDRCLSGKFTNEVPIFHRQCG